MRWTQITAGTFGLLAVSVLFGGCVQSPVPPAVKASLSTLSDKPKIKGEPKTREQACEKINLVTKLGTDTDVQQNSSLQIGNIITLASEPQNANRLLDCIIGLVKVTSAEVTKPGMSAAEIEIALKKETFHKQQFRGHMVVTLLTRYAMFNYTGSLGPEGRLSLNDYRDGPDDAALTLGHIEVAQRYLRQHIKVINPNAQVPLTTTTGHIAFEESERLHRVLAVMQILIDAHRPSIGRARNFVLNIISAIGGTPGAITEVLRKVGKSLTAAVVVRVFSDAYMHDAIEYWKDLDGRTVNARDWYIWDKKLEQACIVMLAYSGGSKHHCFAGTPNEAEFPNQKAPAL